MKGTWKEQLGGYNSKDSKRKRQSRKHTLKDSLSGLMKANFRKDKNIDSYIESPLLIRTEVYTKDEYSVGKLQLNESTSVYLVKVSYKKDYRPHKEGYLQYEEEILKVWIPESENRRKDYALMYSTGEDILTHLGLDEFYCLKENLEYINRATVVRYFDLSIQILKEVDYVTWDIYNDNRLETKKEEVSCGVWIKDVYVYGKLVKYQIPYWSKGYSGKFAKQMGSRITRKKFKAKIKKERYEDCTKEDYYRGYNWI